MKQILLVAAQELWVNLRRPGFILMTLLVPAQAGWARRWVARVCAAFAFLVGLLTFTENLWGWDFGFRVVASPISEL